MSKHSLEQITCPNCNKDFEFMVWDSINTVLDPDMKEKVRTGETFQFKCPHCGHEGKVNYGFLYHQMEDRIMIYYVQDRKGYDDVYEMFSGGAIPEMSREMNDAGYLKRIVMSQNELREKLLIFDHDLDDRVIELAKVIFEVVASEQGVSFEKIFFDIDQEGKLIFHLYGNENYIGSMNLSKDVYNTIFERSLSNHPDIRGDRFDIDRGWAVEMLGIDSKEE